MLQVRQLEKIIENRSALYVEQLDLNARDIVAVVGPSNSGKTLLIRLLSGMLLPSSGKVLLDGESIHQSPILRSRIGVLFEEDLLYERLNAQENLALYCQLHKLPRGRVSQVLYTCRRAGRWPRQQQPYARSCTCGICRSRTSHTLQGTSAQR